MRILMPFKIHDGKSIYDSKIMGGLERFAQLLLNNNNHTIVPLEITKEDRQKGRATERILAKSNSIDAGANTLFNGFEEEIDIILSNYEEDSYTTKLLERGNKPVVWIYHTAQDGTFGRVKAVKLMKRFTDLGGHLYFVSEHQHETYNELSNRILGHDVLDIKGYVNPAFCEGFETINPEPPQYDVITIGRTSYMKDPFWIHNKLKDSQLTSAVITTGGHHLESPNEKKYYEANKNWTAPRTVFRDLSHRDGLKTMATGGVFVSTWPLETWGITALESLSHGLPTILLTDKTGKHASEMIAADPSHIRCVPKTISAEDFEVVVRELMTYSPEERQEIARMTQEKHSRQAFMDMYDKVFQKALDNKYGS